MHVSIINTLLLVLATVDASWPDRTRQECLARGGTIVGDIGDGAIHRPSYRCESNGEPPIGTIVYETNQPIAIEGEVCCGPSSDEDQDDPN
jgi:hypothetical protein